MGSTAQTRAKIPSFPSDAWPRSLLACGLFRAGFGREKKGKAAEIKLVFDGSVTRIFGGSLGGGEGEGGSMGQMVRDIWAFDGDLVVRLRVDIGIGI